MITWQIGDITKVKEVDYICNAANGMGPMGAGVASSIKRAGGISIQNEAFYICSQSDYREGDIYITKAGTLPYKNIIHLVTMKNPGGKTSIEIVEKCLKNLINIMRLKKIKKVALPALGTGVGNLNLKDVADKYIEILGPIEDLEFVIVDINPIFISQFELRCSKWREE
jgi:Predicted phosphatase homologous to the C-terminal domain of histone macroH2A1